MLKDKELNALIKHYNTYLGDVEMLEYTPSKNMPLVPLSSYAPPHSHAGRKRYSSGGYCT